MKAGKLDELFGIVSSTLDRKKELETGRIYLRAAKKEEGGFLYLYTTDGTSQTVVKMEATVADPGEASIDGDRFPALISGMDAEAAVKVNQTAKGGLSVKVEGGGSAKIPTFGQSDFLKSRFANMPHQKEPDFTIAAMTLKAIFTGTTRFSQSSDTVENLQGILLTTEEGAYTSYSSNGNALARTRFKPETPVVDIGRLQFSSNSVASMIKILDRQKGGNVSFIRGGTNARGQVQQVYLKTQDVFYGTSLLATEFPQAANVFGKAHDKEFVRINASELHDVLGRVRAFCSDRHLELHFKPGKVFIYGWDTNAEFEQAINTMEWPGQGTTAHMGLNLQYLEWVLSGMKDTVITFTIGQGRARIENFESEVSREYVLAECLANKSQQPAAA